MLRLPEWNEWLDKKHRCLWIHGIPGAGKTVLASHLINQLETHCNSGSKRCITLYYYCYFGNDQNEAAPFLRWITTQLCRSAESIPVTDYSLYKLGRQPNLPQLLTALAASLEAFQTVYIVVDAVDESKPRDDLLKVLRDLVTDSRFDKVQLLATSREYIDIERALEDISEPVSMSNDFITEDIRLYVQAALQKESRFKRWSPELVTEVESTLSVRAKGMFRWAICQIDRLRRLRGDVRAVRNVLATLPKTLDETYERIFTDIPNEDRRIVRQCLAWIDFHNHMYKTNIPCTILLQSINLTGSEDGLHCTDEDLRELCGCLINISTGNPFLVLRDDHAAEVPVVSFAHYTVREFLSSESISPTSPASYFAIGPGSFNDTIRMVYVLALQFDSSHIKDLLETLGETRGESSRKIGGIVFHNLTGSLASYCAWSAFFYASGRVVEFKSHPGLVDLVLNLLNPSHTHFEPITELVRRVQEWLQIMHALKGRKLREDLPFWSLQWQTEPISSTRDAMLLLTVLLCVQDFEPLATALIDRTDKTPVQLCETPLKFQMARYFDWFSWRCPKYTSQDSTIEVFAQLGTGHYGQLRFLLNLPGVPSSADQATSILHVYSTVHQHSEEIDGDCILQRLLKLGADPNGGGYTTTPLQQAVAVYDFEGVELLLDAGAEVNGLGNPGGIMKKYVTRIHGLEDKSPLYICYHHRQCGRSGFFNSQVHGRRRRKIAHLLIQHGAKSLIRQKNGSVVEEAPTESKLLRPYAEQGHRDEWFSDRSSDHDEMDTNSEDSEDGSEDSED